MKYKFVSVSEQVEMANERWYEAIRNRYVTTLLKFSDAELEEGIAGLHLENLPRGGGQK